MRVVAVVGASPGIGKSLLCASLAGWLVEAGWTVDHFEEDHVLTRPAFAQVAADFTTTGTVSPEAFVQATARYLTDAMTAGVDVVVMDSLIPFVPSLMAFGHSEQDIVSIVADLAGSIAAIPVLVVFLDGDPVAALRRAAAREGPDWLRWYAAKLARYGLIDDPEPDLDELKAYLVRERAATLRTLRAQSWELFVVDHADQIPPDAVLHSVRDAVATSKTQAVASSAQLQAFSTRIVHVRRSDAGIDRIHRWSAGQEDGGGAADEGAKNDEAGM